MSTKPRVLRQANNLEHDGERTARNAAASPLMEDLMRLGYVVRGLVYGVMGVLAFQLAVGRGGATTDTQGAIAAMGKTSIGGVLLYVILVGLVGYALWGFIRAALDPWHKGVDTKGIVERVGYAVSGISYGLLAYATYGLITAGASAAQNGAQAAQTQQTTASILTNSWGPWVVGIVALIILGIGFSNIAKGLKPHFDRQFQAYALTSYERTWIDRLGRFGTAARGVVFSLVGLFLFLAAAHRDPSQAKGVDGVLTALLHQSSGPYLLGIVALGLIAFGIYSAMTGFWLRLKR
jgi:hypothetical protein